MGNEDSITVLYRSHGCGSIFTSVPMWSSLSVLILSSTTPHSIVFLFDEIRSWVQQRFRIIFLWLYSVEPFENWNVHVDHLSPALHEDLVGIHICEKESSAETVLWIHHTQVDTPHTIVWGHHFWWPVPGCKREMVISFFVALFFSSNAASTLDLLFSSSSGSTNLDSAWISPPAGWISFCAGFLLYHVTQSTIIELAWSEWAVSSSHSLQVVGPVMPALHQESLWWTSQWDSRILKLSLSSARPWLFSSEGLFSSCQFMGCYDVQWNGDLHFQKNSFPKEFVTLCFLLWHLLTDFTSSLKTHSVVASEKRSFQDHPWLIRVIRAAPVILFAGSISFHHSCSIYCRNSQEWSEVLPAFFSRPTWTAWYRQLRRWSVMWFKDYQTIHWRTGRFASSMELGMWCSHLCVNEMKLNLTTALQFL